MLTLFGFYGFGDMKIQNFLPDIDLPTVIVTSNLPGASPAQLENDVARKIENSVATLQGIKHIYSKVQDGTVTTTVEFRLEKNTMEAVNDVRDAVSRVRADLPGDLRDPIISKMELSGLPILTYTIASDKMSDEELSWFVDNTVARRLLSVKGVGAIARVGGVTREIRVELDPLRLQALNATAADMFTAAARQVQREASGGRTDIGDAEQSVRTLGTVQTANELAAMQIALSDGRRVRLDQVANVTDTVGEQRTEAILNGKPVVGFEITRTRGAGEVEVSHGVLKALDALRKDHPEIEITEAFNFVDPVNENYHGSMYLLYEGAALAVAGGAGCSCATGAPPSIFRYRRAAVVESFRLSASCTCSASASTSLPLLSLSLVIGILVDDAIVEIGEHHPPPAHGRRRPSRQRWKPPTKSVSP